MAPGDEEDTSNPPPSYVKAATRIRRTEEAGCLGRMKSCVCNCLFFAACFPSCRTREKMQRIDNPRDEEMIVALAHKVEKDRMSSDSLGLQFDDDDLEVYISNIAADSPFQNTLLRIGMKVLSINGRTPQTGLEASTFLQQEEEGYIKIEAMVSPGTHQRTKQIIDYAGQREGRHSPGSYAGEIRHIEHPRADQQDLIVKAKVQRNDKNTPLGLSLLRTPEGCFKISAIAPGSTFDGTDLSLGMTVERINGLHVRGRGSLPVIRMLYNSTGCITVEAQATDSSASFACACNHRNHPATKQGKTTTVTSAHEENCNKSTATASLDVPTKEIYLESQQKEKVKNDESRDLEIDLVHDSTTGKYHVRDWPDDSPREAMGLQAGMQLLAINGVQVTGKPIKAVQAMLRKERSEDVQITVAWDDDLGRDNNMMTKRQSNVDHCDSTADSDDVESSGCSTSGIDQQSPQRPDAERE